MPADIAGDLNTFAHVPKVTKAENKRQKCIASLEDFNWEDFFLFLSHELMRRFKLQFAVFSLIDGLLLFFLEKWILAPA